MANGTYPLLSQGVAAEKIITLPSDGGFVGKPQLFFLLKAEKSLRVDAGKLIPLWQHIKSCRLM